MGWRVSHIFAITSYLWAYLKFNIESFVCHSLCVNLITVTIMIIYLLISLSRTLSVMRSMWHFVYELPSVGYSRMLQSKIEIRSFKINFSKGFCFDSWRFFSLIFILNLKFIKNWLKFSVYIQWIFCCLNEHNLIEISVF